MRQSNAGRLTAVPGAAVLITDKEAVATVAAPVVRKRVAVRPVDDRQPCRVPQIRPVVPGDIIACNYAARAAVEMHAPPSVVRSHVIQQPEPLTRKGINSVLLPTAV